MIRLFKDLQISKRGIARVTLPITAWIVIWLLFHNYVYLQWREVVYKKFQIRLIIILVIISFISAVFCCLELSLANTSQADLDAWIAQYKENQPDYHRHYTKYCRYSRLVNNVTLIESYNPVIVLLNNFANTGIAVVLIVLTNPDITVFADSIPGIPFLGRTHLLDGYGFRTTQWLLPGTDGLVTIGIAMILLFAGELIPKRIALRYKPVPLFWLSWLLFFMERTNFRKLVTYTVINPIDKTFELSANILDYLRQRWR